MMKLFQLVTSSVIVATAIAGCKASNSSNTKSFVGLEADINADVAKGQAPSFLLLQQWFAGKIPVDNAAAQYGTIKYQVHSYGSFTDYAYTSIPPEYRNDLIKYYQQQIDRVHDFQQATSNPAQLKALLKVEADEMKDIILVLLTPDYKPVTNDLMAHLFSQPGIRNYVDRFSVELLSQLYKRSLRDLVANMDKERDNFAKLMSDSYVTAQGANPKFISDLGSDCAKLIGFIRALGATPIANCTPSSGFQLGESVPSINAAGQNLTGSGLKYAMAYAGVFAKSGPAGGSDAQPQLSIFAGKDTNAGDPQAGGGTINPTTPTNPTNPNVVPTPLPSAPASDAQSFFKLLSSLWGGNISPNATDPDYDDTSLALASGQVALPPKPRFDCAKTATGMPLVVCQRYASVLPSADTILKGMPKKTSSSNNSSPGSFGLAETYNFVLIAKYHTPIQNQGQEGACTAFGIIHTIQANVKAKDPNAKAIYSAKEQWSGQGQQPYVETAIEYAKKQGAKFDGHRITSDKSLSTVDELKQTIAAGRAVYAASEVDQSWYQPKNNILTCGTADGSAGHAYSIQGFDDDKKVFVMKNSWGDSYGESGYAYLPYKCIDSFQRANFYDLTID